MGMGYPVMGMNMIVDPNMMSMNNYSMMQPIMTESSIIPQVSTDILTLYTQDFLYLRDSATRDFN